MQTTETELKHSLWSLLRAPWPAAVHVRDVWYRADLQQYCCFWYTQRRPWQHSLLQYGYACPRNNTGGRVFVP